MQNFILPTVCWLLLASDGTEAVEIDGKSCRQQPWIANPRHEICVDSAPSRPTRSESLLQSSVSFKLAGVAAGSHDDAALRDGRRSGAYKLAQRVVQNIASGKYPAQPWIDKSIGKVYLDSKATPALLQYGNATNLTENATNATSSVTASEVVGVKVNDPEDMPIFLTALCTNVGVVLVAFFIFGLLHYRLKHVFQANSISSAGAGPPAPHPTVSGWLLATCSLDAADVINLTTFDHGMLIEFTSLATRILSVVGLPVLTFLGPLHLYCGGNRAENDELSKIGMANVQNDSWLYWVHAGTVWYVVVVTEGLIFLAQHKFVQWRQRWMAELPLERSCTVLVEALPTEMQTEVELVSYFDNHVFKQPVVLSVSFLKDTTDLQKYRQSVAGKSGPANVARSEEAILGLQRHILHDSTKNLSTAFVTFKNRHDVETALRMFNPDAAAEFDMHASPDPSDLIWADLVANGHCQIYRDVLGYILVVLLFLSFLPLVVGISAFTKLDILKTYVPFHMLDGFVERQPAFARFWDGLMGSFALSFLMGLLPTAFEMIFSYCFIHRAQTVLQHRLHRWAFRFLVVFVLLVTAVGSSLIQTAENLIQQPASVFTLLANTLPSSSHFYLNWVPMQWAALAMQLLRPAVLAKFSFFRCLGYSDDEAIYKAEPEDQGAYGIGFRSAHLTLTLVTTLVFCTLSPLIIALGIVHFTLARLVYGYLFVYAEHVKADLGGAFFVTQIDQLQAGLALYVILMTGVLLERAETIYPGYIAAAAIVPLGYAHLTLKRKSAVADRMPFNKLFAISGTPNKHTAMQHFRQPELCDNHSVGSPHVT